MALHSDFNENYNECNDDAEMFHCASDTACVSNEKVIYPKKAKPRMPKHILCQSLKEIVNESGLTWDESIDDDLPKKWKIFSDLAVLPSNCFNHEIWLEIGKSIFK